VTELGRTTSAAPAPEGTARRQARTGRQAKAL
jgi:hypothetical protein